MEFKKSMPYDINIIATSNEGFIVKVGCCTTVYESTSTMLAAIEEYVTNPRDTVKKYYEETGPQCDVTTEACDTPRASGGVSGNIRR